MYSDSFSPLTRKPNQALPLQNAFHLGLGRVRLDVGEAQRYGYVDRDGSYVWFPSD